MSENTKDYEWINENYSLLQAKYPNMYVAVKDGEVISANKEFGKTYKETKKKAGENFVTDYILSGEPFVLVNLQNS
jgi:hypothetical protein